MAKNTTKKQEVTLNDIYNLVVDLGNRVSALEENRTKSSTSSSKKSGTGKKFEKSSSDDFDRAEYVAAAKKLGVYSDKMHRAFAKVGKNFNPDGNIVVRFMNGDLTEKQAKAEISKHYPDLYKGGKKRA